MSFFCSGIERPCLKGTPYVRTETTDIGDEEDEDGYKEEVCTIYVGNRGRNNETQILSITSRQCVGSWHKPYKAARKILDNMPRIQDVLSREVDAVRQKALDVKKEMLRQI